MIFLLVELHRGLLQRHAVVAVLGFQLLHLRLHLLHVRHGSVLLVGEREEQGLDDDRGDQDRDAEIAEVAVDEVHQLEHRLGEEPEPAPVDHQVELRDRVGGLVAADDRHFLGAAEEQVLDLGLLAGRDGDVVLAVVRLVGAGGRR